MAEQIFRIIHNENMILNRNRQTFTNGFITYVYILRSRVDAKKVLIVWIYNQTNCAYISIYHHRVIHCIRISSRCICNTNCVSMICNHFRIIITTAVINTFSINYYVQLLQSNSE